MCVGQGTSISHGEGSVCGSGNTPVMVKCVWVRDHTCHDEACVGQGPHLSW